MENAAGASGSLPGAGCVASLSLSDSAGLSLPRSPARKLFKTVLMSSDAAETGGFAAGGGREINAIVTWPGPDDRDDEERVAPGEVAVEPVAQE